MAKLSTQPADAAVATYLAAIEDPARQNDCQRIIQLMTKATGKPPRMWGTAIIGFDSYHYRYESGHEGDWCIVGFSSRKAEISVYLLAGYESPKTQALLDHLGKHRIGKSCLYIKRLSDVDVSVLETLIVQSVEETRRLWPST